jgi:hypothetical protein
VSRAAGSVLTFGAYLALLGAGLFVSPDGMLSIFGQPPTQEPWLRVLGIVSAGSRLLLRQRRARRADAVLPRDHLGARPRRRGLHGAGRLRRGARFVLLMAGLDGAGALWTWSALRRPRR